MRTQLAALLTLLTSQAYGQCDAWYRFDGDLRDAGGNGYHGEMIGADGVAAAPQFTDGVDGQALQLDGNSAMRAFVDLHSDICPQITVAGWLRADASVTTTQYLLSTGGGGRVGLRSGGRIVTLEGSGNGLAEREALRDPRVWFFFAGVYDYKAQTYRFHWRERILTGKLPESPAPPEDVVWIGAQNDLLHYATRGAALDELRIIGRALDDAEIAALRGGRLSAVVPGATTTSTSSVAGISAQLGTLEPVVSAEDLPERSVPPLLPGGDLREASGEGGEQAAPTEGVVGVSGQLGTLEPVVSAEDLPERSVPPLLPGGDLRETSSDEDVQVELREVVGPGLGLDDPELSLPEDDPGSQFREQLDTIAQNPPVVDEITCEASGDVALTVRRIGAFPERFINAIQQVQTCGYYPRVVALNDKDQWIISAGNQIARSTNLPGELSSKLDEFERNYGELDAADIAIDGSWLIVAGDDFAASGVPSGATARAQSIINSGDRVASFTINSANPAQWLMADYEGVVYGDDIPAGIVAETADSQLSRRMARQVRYLPDGSWVLLGNDHWFVSDGLTPAAIRQLGDLRNGGNNLDHVLGHKAKTSYLILSYGELPRREGDPIWLSENNLKGKNIWARLSTHNLTGASVAVIRNNQIAWARGYGLRDVNDLESYVRTDTTFDVASVSKAVAAFTLMQLAQAGQLNLEENLEDIEGIIPQDKLEDFRDDVRPEGGNVIQVLQHCAGFCYARIPDCQYGGGGGGAQEYSDSLIPPTTAQVITGSGAAFPGSRPLRTSNFGLRHRYTSANYILIQALIDVHGGGFVSHTNKLFSDLGMLSSTFVSPYQRRNGGKFARGHEKGVRQSMVGYGEMAAASLVSTATDIARFVIALNRDGQGLLPEPWFDVFVGRDSSMLKYCNDAGSMALGINRLAALDSWGGNEVIWHHGDHNGYHAKMIALPGIKSGIVVIMTGDGDDTNSFYFELKDSVKAAYGI